MGKPQALSKLQQSGGSLGKQPDKATMCKAFKKAVTKWCKDGKGNRNGDFNDYYFRSLYGTKGGRAGALGKMRDMREAVFMNPHAAGGAASQMTQSGSFQLAAMGASSKAVQYAYPTSGSATARAFRGRVLGMWSNSKLWGTGKPMFPDAVLRGTPVEIKGPNDTLSTKQAKKYQKIQGRGKLVVISCQSCKASCAKTNKC